MTEQRVSELILPPIHDKRIGSWGHASGRVASLQTNLFGKSGLDRLFAVATENDIKLLLQEHHYPQEKFSKSLQDERISVFDFLQEVAPEDAYRTALLLFSDIHNLKFMLKEHIKDDERNFSEVEHLVERPSLVDAADLYNLVHGRREVNRNNAWIVPLIEKGKKAYSDSYDTAAIDRELDKDAHLLAQQIAKLTGNEWFIKLFAIQRDLVNLETLLRVRHRSLSKTLYKESLLPSGLLSKERLIQFYDAENEEIAKYIKNSPYHSLAHYVETYGQKGQAPLLVRDREQILIDHIAKGRKVLRGPELILSYVLARQFEIKNIRIVEAAIRNGLPLSQRQSLRRDLW